jgi:hypothetical protein
VVAKPKSTAEFRDAMEAVFTLLSEDPEMGPKLRDADVPQRFDFDDLGLVLNARSARAGEPGNLHWEWGENVGWESKVRMTMSSETAVRYFQGRENVPIAIARRRIKAGGDVKAALTLIPITKPVYAQFREVVQERWPHLAA